MMQPYAAEPAPAAPDTARGVGWVVFGAGGHARSVVDVLERSGQTVVAVAGDAAGRAWHVPVLADDAAGLAQVAAEGLCAAVAIGAPGPRLAVLERLLALPSLSSAQNLPAEGAHSTVGEQPGRPRVGVVVAATATVAPDVELGPGTVVLEHAHVGPGSRVGSGVIVNTAAIVEHDCVVGDGVHVAPGAALLGGATVGARTVIGSGARVLPLVAVGSGATVGAGSVVTRAVGDGVTVAGVPARVLDRDVASREETT